LFKTNTPCIVIHINDHLKRKAIVYRPDQIVNRCMFIYQGTEMTSVDGVNHKIASMSTLQSGGLNTTLQIIQLFDKVRHTRIYSLRTFVLC